MGVTAPNVPENDIEDFANTISILFFFRCIDKCDPMVYKIMLYFNLSLTSSFEKIKISTKDGFDESFINIIHDHWTLAISHFLLSFPRSTLGPQQSSIVCIGLTADMGFSRRIFAFNSKFYS